MILRICRNCGLPITDNPRVAAGQAVCCCLPHRVGIEATLRGNNNERREQRSNAANKHSP